MEKKEELIRTFWEILWSDRENFQAEIPPWENVEVLDIIKKNDSSFLVLTKRRFQTLHKLADYETFEYSEVYQFSKVGDKFSYQLLCRVLYLHNYTHDGFQSIYNTRRWDSKDLFIDENKKLEKIISDMKFLSESGKKVVLKEGDIEELRKFQYRYRPE